MSKEALLLYYQNATWLLGIFLAFLLGLIYKFFAWFFTREYKLLLNRYDNRVKNMDDRIVAVEGKLAEVFDLTARIEKKLNSNNK